MGETLLSVFAQRYQNWELLLIDDGSSDASSSLARRYAAQYAGRVQYLEHPGHDNLGMSASRNLGIRHACGQYLALIDADDVWEPCTLEEQVAILDAEPEAAMVYGRLLYWFSWSELPEDEQRDYIEELGVEPGTLIQPPTLLPLFLQDKAAVPSGLLVRRAALEKHGGFEDAFRGEYEDQVFCAKICLHAAVIASSQCWYRYRQHPDSCVSRSERTGRGVSARRTFLKWLANYLSSQGVQSKEVWQALCYEWWRCAHPRAFLLWERGRDLARQLNVRARDTWTSRWNNT